MAQKRVVAPDTPITAYPTPEIANIVITVDVDSRLPGYKALEYGTLYPDQTRYPGAKLVAQTPLEDDRFVRRIYATDRIKQETYNYAIKFSAGSPDHPIYTRTFIEARETYTPLADNSPDPVIPGAYLVDEEAAPADGELNNLYLSVTRIYETLPGPWIPSSRYDDDLGLVQSRRRSVVNEGQVATLSADKRTSYEARDESTGVYIELEESWSIATDNDGNSLFPIRDRDFYDASRGPVQERRQLFVPTGNEVGSLENVDGVITQISYEPYNEFLSAKITQTYSVDGPQLVGKATNNEGQLVTITTQRKGADSYVAPNPTATRTVEVSREDAESVIERVIDTPQVFDGKILSASKPDVIPESFRASVPAETTQETVAQTSVSMPVLGSDDLEKSEQRVGEHTVRKSTTSRDNGILPTLTGQQYESDVNIVVKYDESVVASGTKLGSPATIVNPLSDDLDLVREFDVDAIEEELNSLSLEFPSRTSLSLPPVLRSVKIVWTSSKEDGSYTSTGNVPTAGLGSGSVSETGNASCSSSVKPDFVVELEDVYANNIPTTSYLFFLKYPVKLTDILDQLQIITGKPVLQWPVFKPRSETIVASGQSKSVRVSVSGSYSISGVKQSASSQAAGITSYMISRTNGKGYGGRTEESVATLQIPPCLRGTTLIQEEGDKTVTGSATVNFNWGGGVAGNENRPATSVGKFTGGIVSTDPPDIPRKDLYLIDSKVDLYQYGFARIYAEVLDASIFANPTV